MKKIIEVAILLLVFGSLTAQCLIRDISIAERHDLSSYITNAIVLDKYCFKDDQDGHIYTFYTLQELDSQQTIYLTVRGGKYEDLIEVVNPSLVLNILDQGVFYLNKAPIVQSKKEVYTPAVGVLSFLKYDIDKHIFYDFLNKYESEDIGVDYVPFKFRNTFNDSKNRFSPPVINSILPKVVTAGTKQIITIKGNNFGSSAVGLALIEFRNPDFASGTVKAYQSVSPDHILSWKHNKIEVIVPGRDPYLGKSGAGSGNIRLRNTAGEIIFSSQEITVVSNRFVKGVNATLLINDNDFGGYSLSYNNDFNDNILATEAFERALQSWQCGVHSSYVAIGNTDAGTCPTNDGVNLVSFEKDCKLSPELLAQTTHWFISCSSENTILLEMDIIFDKDVNWHFDTINPPYNKFDFESIALHELGHAHGLAHVLEESNIMFPNYFLKEKKRIIDTNSISCGLGIVDISSEINECTDVDSFLPYPDCSLPCTLLANAIQSSDCDIDGYVEYIITVIDTNGSGAGFTIYQDGILETNEPILYNNWGQTTVKIKILGDELIHVLKIQDISDVNCWYELQVLPVSCQCTMDVSLSQISNCNDEGMLTYILEVINTNGSEMGFEVKIDGELTQESPHIYTVSGSTFINIDIIGDELEHIIEINDFLDTSCQESISVITPNCQCQLSMAVLDSEGCDTGDSIKYTIKIFSSNIGDSGFNVLVDDQLIANNPFPYLSSDTTTIIIWIVGDGNEHKIAIIDGEKETCNAALLVKTENCICDITMDIIQNGDCNNEGLIEYIITVDQQSINNDSFDLKWNENLIEGSPFQYDPSGTTVIHYFANGNGLNQQLTFLNQQNVSCIVNKDIIVPNCNCELSGELIQTSDCNEDGNVNYRLIIKNTNADATNFNVWVDNTLLEGAPFNYMPDSTNIDIILLGDGLSHMISTEDVFTQNCKEEFVIITPVCTCGLSLTGTQISECNDNNKTLWSLEISDINGSTSGFDIFLDDVIVDPLGYFYTSPKTFINIEIPGDDLIHQIKIQDRSDLLCQSTISIQAEDCSCSFSLEAALDADCDEENYVEIIGSLIQANLPSDSFYILVDGLVLVDSPFAYDSPEFTNFNFKLFGDGELHTIEVYDALENDCNSSTMIQLPDCNDETPCQLKYTAIQVEDCKGDNFVFNIKFEGPNNPLDKYDVYINNDLVANAPFNYHTSGINTITLNATCEQAMISIRDNQNSDCKIDTIINPSVAPNSFSIYPNLVYFDQIDLTIKGIELDDYDRLLPVYIYNIIGENVYNDYILGSSKMNMSIESLNISSGVYYFVMGSKEQYKERLVIIK